MEITYTMVAILIAIVLYINRQHENIELHTFSKLLVGVLLVGIMYDFGSGLQSPLWPYGLIGFTGWALIGRIFYKQQIKAVDKNIRERFIKGG